MWVTLNTEASWERGRARCSFFAVGASASDTLRGRGSASCDSDRAAEMISVLHGVRKVHESYAESGLEGVVVHSKSSVVVASLQRGWDTELKRDAIRATRSDSHMAKAHNTLMEFCLENGIRLQIPSPRGR